MERFISYLWVQQLKAQSWEFNLPHPVPGSQLRSHVSWTRRPHFPRLRNRSNSRTYSCCCEDSGFSQRGRCSHNLLISPFSPIKCISLCVPWECNSGFFFYSWPVFSSGKWARLEETSQQYGKRIPSEERTDVSSVVHCWCSTAEWNLMGLVPFTEAGTRWRDGTVKHLELELKNTLTLGLLCAMPSTFQDNQFLYTQPPPSAPATSTPPVTFSTWFYWLGVQDSGPSIRIRSWGWISLSLGCLTISWDTIVSR